MCGIAGVHGFGTGETASEGTLRAMADAMVHRGPDDEGLYRDETGGLGFAFRRLAIVDLEHGAQPMTTADGRFTIVFNGEIYNHVALRAGLETEGRTFRTRCDTEVILEGFAAHGHAFVERLQGMFALAVWDAGERRLVLARDRVGIKPLYWAVRGGTLVFASEIKCLFQHSAVEPELNRDQLATFFTFLTVPAPDTLFAGVHKLPPAHTVTVDARGVGEPVRYWDPLARPMSSASPGELAEELGELLDTAVRDRLMSDVPFGAFLSGGIDSSAIVALMARALDRPVETFSVGYKNDPAFNEFEHARHTAQLFGTNHHEILIDHEDFRQFLPRLVHHQDEPIADPVCVPLYFVAELARKNGVIVTQVGEGADELFFGYAWHDRVRRMVDRWWRPVSALPTPLRQAATRAAEPFVDLPRRDFLRRLGEGGEPFWGGAVTFFPEELKRLSPELAGDRRRAETVARYYAEYDAQRDPHDFPNRAGYLELAFRLPELLLMRVDKMTMATSVEGRVPFLDHRMVEFAFSVPGRHKVEGGVTKALLKRAVRGLIPDEIIDRPKVGFHVPVTRWFEAVLAPLAEELLFDPRLLALGVWDQVEVRRLLAQQRAGRGNLGMRIWALVNFALWYRHWFLEDHR